MLSDITPVILTWNEEPNIARTLGALSWAREVVVLDSGSSDRTVEIARAHPNVRVLARAFDAHATQWNFAIGETGITTGWILALDADYVLTPALVEEIGRLEPPPEVAGYRTRFEYCVVGKTLRGSVYPPVVTLYRRGQGSYQQDGHTQRLSLAGECRNLGQPIRHDDRKPLRRWLASQVRYAELEAAKLVATPFSRLGWPDRVRRTVVLAPPLMFVYALVARGAVLDGLPGLYYSLQRLAAEVLLSLHLLDAYLQRNTSARE